MDKDNRIHRLLGHILSQIPSGDRLLEYKPMIPYIKPWYQKLYYLYISRTKDEDFYEVRLLCRKLYTDKIVSIEPGEFEIDIDGDSDLQYIRDAFYGNVYKEQNAGIIAIYVSTILNALAATALVVLTFVSNQRNEILQLQSEEIKQLNDESERIILQSQLLMDSVLHLKIQVLETKVKIQALETQISNSSKRTSRSKN